MGMFWDKGIMLITGCKKVSPGCKNCWSEREHYMRSCRKAPGVYASDLLTDKSFNGTVSFNMHLLRAAAKVKVPHVYAIWNDLYILSHGAIIESLQLMERYPHHTYLIITKRTEEAARFWQRFRNMHQSHGSNIWHIATTENQEQADSRIPHLLRIPGKRGIIIEPMLEGIDITKSYSEDYCVCTGCGHFGLHCGYDNYECVKCQCHKDNPDDGACAECGSSMERICPSCGGNDSNDDFSYGPVYTYREEFPKLPGIHQVICGPENGAGKRPFDPAWADSVRAQCGAAGVPFYRKDTEEGQLAWRTS